MSKITPSQALDEILLDIVVAIEPSDHDRAITDRRYKALNDHLTKPGGELSQYLTKSSSVNFPQGSVAAGTIVVSGDNNDRFDLDAVVRFRIPDDWSDNEALERLEKVLQGFPNVKKIFRCTRRVQMVFANIHLDVTVLDPEIPLNTPEPGEIFHNPDKGRSYRICATRMVSRNGSEVKWLPTKALLRAFRIGAEQGGNRLQNGLTREAIRRRAAARITRAAFTPF